MGIFLVRRGTSTRRRFILSSAFVSLPRTAIVTSSRLRGFFRGECLKSYGWCATPSARNFDRQRRFESRRFFR
jgi:hypothetical protein